jgi:hypothetical protein
VHTPSLPLVHTFVRLGNNVDSAIFLLDWLLSLTRIPEPRFGGVHEHIAGIFAQLNGKSVDLVQSVTIGGSHHFFGKQDVALLY